MLACTQPAGSSESWLDCDDTDPSVYPGAPETGGNRIDQDCNGEDAEGEPEDTGGETPGDTAPPGDDTGTADGDGLTPPPDSPKSGCQCGTRSTLPPAGLLGLALLLVGMRRRRFG